jgi:hypothetical protein
LIEQNEKKKRGKEEWKEGGGGIRTEEAEEMILVGLFAGRRTPHEAIEILCSRKISI